jgi:hypothetical protein
MYVKSRQGQAALVPRPRLHLIRFHGVLAQNAKLRPVVVPQGRPAQGQAATEAAAVAESAVENESELVQARPHRTSWARLLKRVIDIDMQHCPSCGGGELKIIAAILDRPVVEKILTHLGLNPQPPPPRAGVRGRARFCGLSYALNHAGRHKHHARGLQRKTAAGAATRDAWARHLRNQGHP